MVRIAVGIEYDGTAYAGWQTPADARTVQRVTEKALAAVAAEPWTSSAPAAPMPACMRAGQVAHFDTHAARSMRSWVLGANSELPADVSVSWALPVPAHFHARYLRRGAHLSLCHSESRSPARRCCSSAPLGCTGRSIRSAWRRRHAPWWASTTSAPFAPRSARPESPIRRLESLSVERYQERIVIEATANAFLHHMVRNIAGLLIAIGKGKAPPEWAHEVLAGRDRTRSAATAPACGLYLWSVRYPAAFGLPVRRAAEAPLTDRL